MVGTNEPIRRHRPRTVRSETFRRKALNLLNGISIGLRSGEYCGRYCTVAPKASITLLHAGNFVGREVIHHHDIVALEHRRQALLHIGHESWSIDRSIDDHRGHHLVMPQGSDECDRLPCSLRNMAEQSLATRTTSPETDHIDAGRSLIDKHQSRRIKKALLPNP